MRCARLGGVYDRFTDAARAVVARAEAEAYARGAVQVEPEDVVVALAAYEGVAGNVLRAVAADVAVLRVGVETTFAPSMPDPDRPRPLPLSHASAAAFSIAGREADGLRLEHVGTEHLLLGLLREPGGRAGALLVAVRRDPGMVRERILDLVSSPGFRSPEVPLAPEPRATHDDAPNPALSPTPAGAGDRTGSSTGGGPDQEDVVRALVIEAGRLREELGAVRAELAELRDRVGRLDGAERLEGQGGRHIA